MNKLTIVATIAVATIAVASANAQTTPSSSQLDEINLLSLSYKEGTRPIRDLNGPYTRTYTYTIDSVSDSENTTISDPIPIVSDNEILKAYPTAEAYLKARIARNKNRKIPHFSIQSLRTIYPGDEQKIQEIAYGKISVAQIVENELAVRTASEKQITDVDVAEGY